MTDFAKRRTLKGIAAATATIGFATHTLAATEADGLKAASSLDTTGHLAIHTRVSAKATMLKRFL